MATSTQTYLAYQHDAKLLAMDTSILSLRPFSKIEEANQSLFKGADSETDHILVTKETIFHPQGGGQPSDEGFMTVVATSGTDTPTTTSSETKLQVKAVRMDVVHDGQVLHLVSPTNPTTSTPLTLNPGTTIHQTVDADKRLLYSRLHTAGHVLGSAVRTLLENQVPDFDELKASHFPGQASCEFQGLIDGKHKDEIQRKVDELVAQALPVEIDFWTEEDFRARGLARLIPERKAEGEGQQVYRVVNIVGADIYPCGGTHVDSTDLCGQTTVRKISRSKGTSRVSYTVV